MFKLTVRTEDSKGNLNARHFRNLTEQQVEETRNFLRSTAPLGQTVDIKVHRTR